jgi:hypothetical protein
MKKKSAPPNAVGNDACNCENGTKPNVKQHLPVRETTKMTKMTKRTDLRELEEAAGADSCSAVGQEMKLAHMNTIAGRLNLELLLNYEEYCRAVQDGTLKEISRSKLESVMTDFGGLSVEELSEGEKGSWLLYVNPELRGSGAAGGATSDATLMFDGEFFIAGSLAERIRLRETVLEHRNDQNELNGFFEFLVEKAARVRGEIETVLTAIPRGQLVYIGDCGYYVYGLNPIIAILHSQAEIDALALTKSGLSGRIRDDGLPVQEYILDIRDFREAVTSNPRNEDIIAKLGFTKRDPSVPFVPSLEFEPGSEEFYAVGDRVFLDNDRECLIQAVGNERVWYLNMLEMPSGAAIPDEKKATVAVERQGSFEKQFFGNLRNLELVRRRKHRDPFDLLAEMNRDRDSMREEKRRRRTNKSRER